MKFRFSLIAITIALIACSSKEQKIVKETKTDEILNPFVGAWLLDSTTQANDEGEMTKVDIFKKGLIMYTNDGYMSAILTYSDKYGDTPGMDVGYCGKYELNQTERYVNHLRDVIAINADTENEVFTRDYKLSDEGNFLTLSPREKKWKGTSLTWKKVDQ